MTDCTYFYVIYQGECLSIKKNKFHADSRMLMTPGNIVGLEALSSNDSTQIKVKYEISLQSSSESTLFKISASLLNNKLMEEAYSYLLQLKSKSEKCRTSILKEIETNQDKFQFKPIYLSSSIKAISNNEHKRNYIQTEIEKTYLTMNQLKKQPKSTINVESIKKARSTLKISCIQNNPSEEKRFSQLSHESLSNILNTPTRLNRNSEVSLHLKNFSNFELDKLWKSKKEYLTEDFKASTPQTKGLDNPIEVSRKNTAVLSTDEEFLSPKKTKIKVLGSAQTTKEKAKKISYSIPNKDNAFLKEMKLHFRGKFIKQILSDQSKLKLNRNEASIKNAVVQDQRCEKVESKASSDFNLSPPSRHREVKFS